MSMTEVQSIVRERGTKFGFSSSSEGGKKSSKYSKEDIITAIGKLSKLGSGFRTVQIGKSTMVVSVPTELDNDHMEVMTIAQDVAERTAELGRVSVGDVTIDDVTENSSWDDERAKRALDLLLSKGMAWLDVFEGEERYWFPSIWKEGLTVDGEASVIGD